MRVDGKSFSRAAPGAGICSANAGTTLPLTPPAQPREAKPFTRQELLGHESVETTQIYTHVMKKPGLGVRSPLDLLDKSREQSGGRGGGEDQ